MRSAHRATLPLLVALAMIASGVGWQLAAVAHPPGSAGSPSSPLALTTYSSSVTIPGNWVVKTSTADSSETINVEGGVQIDSGATLTLDDVNLFLAEPSSVANGIEVRGGAGLVGQNVNFDSLTPANHLWMRADSGATLSLTGGSIHDLGGAQGGDVGLVLQNSGSVLNGVHFDQYYVAVQATAAPYTTLTRVFVGNSTAGSSGTYAVQVSGTSAHFSLTNSAFVIPQPVGAIMVSTPFADVVHNHFTLDPTTPLQAPIHFGYTGDGTANAADSYIANNSIYGAGIIVDVASGVTIRGNSVIDTGANGPYGILIDVPPGTAPGLWSTGDLVENNYISDYSRYGIRFELNVSHFLIQGNLIVNPSPTPGPAWTEKWGGPQIDGIYLIRGINNGTVNDNILDLSDVPGVACNGMSIESNVNTLRVTNNVFYNVTQNGLMLQGDVPGFVQMLPWQAGPTFNLFIANNQFINERYVQQTNFGARGILDWLWTNHTTVENNTFTGWQNVNTQFSANGAVVLSDGSYGTYVNNTVNGARWGFIFNNYGGVQNPYPGEFNRSDNLVYNNHLYGITQGAIEETPNDGMGPLHNVVNVLENSNGPGPAPSGYLESIGPVSQVGLSEANGVFTQTFRTTNPITGATNTFSTSIDWQLPRFSVSSVGTVGTGPLTLTLDSVNTTQVSYSLSAEAVSEETVSVQAPVPSYTAWYKVSVSAGQTASWKVNSSSGPAAFAVGQNGPARITVSLLSWNHVAGPPNNTISAVYGTVLNDTNQTVAGASVTLGFQQGGTETGFVTMTTDPDGRFAASNLSFQGNVSTVEVGSGVVPVTAYAVTGEGEGVLNVTVWVHDNSTLPGGSGGGGPPPPALVNEVVGAAVNSAGAPVANLSIAVQFETLGGGNVLVNATTAGDGSFDVDGLNFTGNLSTVQVNASGYVLHSYYLNPSPSGVLDLTLWVDYMGQPTPVSTVPSAPTPPSDPTNIPVGVVAVACVLVWGVAAIAIVRPALAAARQRRLRWPY